MSMKAAAMGAAMLCAIVSEAAAAALDLNAVAAAARQPIAPGEAANTTTIEPGPDGARVVRVTLPGGFRYAIVNDQCVKPGDPPTGCERLGFIVVYGAGAGAFSIETINQWNGLRPPQAFVTSDGLTVMAHYIYVRDGFSAVNLQHNMEFWNNSLITFDQFGSQASKQVTIEASARPPLVHDDAAPTWFGHGFVGEADVNERFSLID